MSGNDDTLRINNPMYSKIYEEFCNYVHILSVLSIKLYNNEEMFELRTIICDIANKIENNLIICTDGEIFDNQVLWNWYVYVNDKFDVHIAEISFEHDVINPKKTNVITEIQLLNFSDFARIVLRFDDYSISFVKHENNADATYKIMNNRRSLI